VSLPSIRFAVESAKGEIPVVANGDAWGMREVALIRESTGVQGVMSARGLLANPALFSGYDHTPPEAIQDFIHIAMNYGGLPFALFHRHIGYMLESRFVKPQRSYFNSLTSHAGVIDFLEANGLDVTCDPKGPG